VTWDGWLMMTVPLAVLWAGVVAALLTIFRSR
jgi:hypothetical protein